MQEERLRCRQRFDHGIRHAHVLRFLGPPRRGRQPEGAQGGVAPVDGEAALREQRSVGLVEGAPAEMVAHGVGANSDVLLSVFYKIAEMENA